MSQVMLHSNHYLKFLNQEFRLLPTLRFPASLFLMISWTNVYLSFLISLSKYDIFLRLTMYEHILTQEDVHTNLHVLTDNRKGFWIIPFFCLYDTYDDIWKPILKTNFCLWWWCGGELNMMYIIGHRQINRIACALQKKFKENIPPMKVISKQSRFIHIFVIFILFRYWIKVTAVEASEKTELLFSLEKPLNTYSMLLTKV